MQRHLLRAIPSSVIDLNSTDLWRSKADMPNFFDQLPKAVVEEHFSDMLKTDSVRIERIVSKGHSSPQQGWYDQEDHEWVMVLEGCGTLLFEDGREVVLQRGDYIHIPAHVRHKVTRTDPDQLTVWLAVFFRDTA